MFLYVHFADNTSLLLLTVSTVLNEVFTCNWVFLSIATFMIIYLFYICWGLNISSMTLLHSTNWISLYINRVNELYEWITNAFKLGCERSRWWFKELENEMNHMWPSLREILLWRVTGSGYMIKWGTVLWSSSNSPLILKHILYTL